MPETFHNSALPNHPQPASSYKEQAYHQIKDAILFQRFQTGVMYSQESICSELGLNRTPVREALLELQKEGLVSYVRNRGIQIVPVTQAEAHNILEARIYIEKTATHLAAQRAGAGELLLLSRCLEETRANLTSGDPCLLYRIDHHFHRLIADMTHNNWIARMADMILDQYLRFEDMSVYLKPESAQLILEEHTKIYDAIASHDPALSEATMQVHLNNSYSRTVHMFWY